MRSRALAVRRARGFRGISHASPKRTHRRDERLLAHLDARAGEREGGRASSPKSCRRGQKTTICESKRVVGWLLLGSLDVCPGRNWQGKFAKENSSHIADFCPRWEGGAVEMLEPWRVAPRFAVNQGASAAPFLLLSQTFCSMPSRSSSPRPTSPSRAVTSRQRKSPIAGA